MKISAHFEYKLQDMWIGVFWRGWYTAYVEDGKPRIYQDTGNPYDFLHIWICILPCLPLHIECSKEAR